MFRVIQEFVENHLLLAGFAILLAGLVAFGAYALLLVV
jgi:hypothetical protein